jgi:hypothetical protein
MEPSKISVVIVSGSLERLQMAAMVASVGAVSGNRRARLPVDERAGLLQAGQ